MRTKEVRRLHLEDFAQERDAFDSAVQATPHIDHFCSSSLWILPASQALMPPRESWIHEDEGHYWAFMRGAHPEGFYYLEALEAMWALPCPSVGTDLGKILEGLIRLCEQEKTDWRIMALSGMQSSHPLFQALVRRYAKRYRMGLGRACMRMIADLSDGLDDWLGRRRRNFRKSLRKQYRRAEEAGVYWESGGQECGRDVDRATIPQVFERIMAIEAAGWKGRQGVGAAEGEMRAFYEKMLPMLVSKGALRLYFARREEEDLAYILGGVWGQGYRGLQFSYNQDYSHLGLGNCLQFHQIKALCSEDVKSYDLGTYMEYKEDWADNHLETETLLILRDS